MVLLEINNVHKHKYSATTTTTTSTMNERAPLVPLSASIVRRAFESADVEASKAYHQTKQEEVSSLKMSCIHLDRKDITAKTYKFSNALKKRNFFNGYVPRQLEILLNLDQIHKWFFHLNLKKSSVSVDGRIYGCQISYPVT